MPKRTDEEIVRDHQRKYSMQRGFLAKAEASVRYWSKRAGSSHGKEMLQAAVARRALRRKNVAAELRIIERHRDNVDSVSHAGLAFIAGQEGFRAKPYRDVVGVLTQGYGETHPPLGGSWSRAYALKRLIARVNRDYLRPVLNLAANLGLELKQSEVDALASVAYNLGTGVFEAGHSLGDALRSKNRQRIADAILLYDKAGSPPRRLLGLTLRRRAERKMFLS